MIVLAILNTVLVAMLQPVIDLMYPGADGKYHFLPKSIKSPNYEYFPWLQQFLTGHYQDFMNFENYIITHRWQVFVSICVSLLVIGLMKFMFTYAQQFLIESLSERLMLDIRTQLYEHMHTLSLRYFSSKDTGTLMSRITFDVECIGRSMVNGIGEMIKEPLVMVGLVVLMFSVNWKLSLVTALFFPLVVLPLVKIGKKIRGSSRKLLDEKAQLNKLLLETITGIRIVKAFGMEDYEMKRFRKKTGDLFATTMRIIRYSALSSPLTEFIGVIGVVGTLMIAAYFIKTSELTAGQFTSFMAAMLMFYQPFKRLTNANNQFQSGMAGAERVFLLLDTPTDVKDPVTPKPVERPKNEIWFENVDFFYDETHPVLQHINLHLPINKVIAVVGPSGAGKTTLMNLIPRFYDPTGGNIYIDGINLKDYSLKQLRGQMGIVTQETILFDDTIFNNIAYGHPDYDEEKVRQAAKIAHADDFIRQLPEGYNTKIGERGVKLSGGQKQRITIARAVLKNPSILIFDEATSSLDAESERLVQDALDKLMLNRTTFVIAHRLTTILRADIILVLEKGKLVEQGTHQELIQKEGLYQRLYQTQFFTEEENQQTTVNPGE